MTSLCSNCSNLRRRSFLDCRLLDIGSCSSRAGVSFNESARTFLVKTIMEGNAGVHLGAESSRICETCISLGDPSKSSRRPAANYTFHFGFGLDTTLIRAIFTRSRIMIWEAVTIEQFGRNRNFWLFRSCVPVAPIPLIVV